MDSPSPVAGNFYQADNYRPEESAGYLMRQVLSLMTSEVEAQLEPTGLTNAQWQPLLKLYWGSAATVAELARECRLAEAARMLRGTRRPIAEIAAACGFTDQAHLTRRFHAAYGSTPARFRRERR